LIRAHWDAEAAVWWAESEDIPGVVAEAATLEALIADLRSLIPELIKLNAVPHPDRIEISITAHRTEAIELAA